MKFKSLKTKIAAAVVAVSMLATGSLAFAYSDAGQELNSWYTMQFGKATAKVYGAVLTRLGLETISFGGWARNVKNTAVANVDAAGDTEAARAAGAITGKAAEYTGQLAAAEGNITAAMPGHFDAVVTDVNGIVNDGLDASQGAAQGVIDRAVNAQGTTSVGQVTTAATAAETQAIADLQAAINGAKSRLAALIEQEKNTAKGEALANLQAKIAEIKSEIQAATDALVQLKIAAITTEGATIEARAKAAMASIVEAIDGINFNPRAAAVADDEPEATRDQVVEAANDFASAIEE